MCCLQCTCDQSVCVKVLLSNQYSFVLLSFCQSDTIWCHTKFGHIYCNSRRNNIYGSNRSQTRFVYHILLFIPCKTTRKTSLISLPNYQAVQDFYSWAKWFSTQTPFYFTSLISIFLGPSVKGCAVKKQNNMFYPQINNCQKLFHVKTGV